MGLLDLLKAALTAVFKILLLTAVGSFLAIDRVALLQNDARKHLNLIVFFVFNPALVLGNLVKTITWKSLVMLWFMPLNILLTFIIGSVLGWIVIKVTRAPHKVRGLVLGCCAAGNLGSMPLIIIPAVCKEKGSPFGDRDDCHTRGMAYASLSLAIASIYMWSYVYNIMRILSSKRPQQPEIDHSATTIHVGETPETSSNCHKENGHFEVEQIVAEDATEDSMLRKIKQYCAVKTNLKHMLAPSTIAAIVGFTISLVPPFRKAFVGDSAPLRVVEDATLMLGDASIPSMSLIVGANLVRGIRGSAGQVRYIIWIIVARYVVLPILGVLIVKGAVHMGFVHPDPLYQFLLMLQYAVPPAMNISTMTQLFGVGESEYSVVMLWSYVCSSVSLTLWSTFFMWSVS